MKLFQRRKFYDEFTSDEFMAWQYDMSNIGLSVSSYLGDYGKATCLNCRSIIDIGVPDLTGFAHGIEHRQVCGDQYLSDLVRRDLPETLSRLTAESRWPVRSAAAGD
jgi:hypothetical protein